MVQRDMSRCRDWSEFCQPYELRRNALGAALRAYKDARNGAERRSALVHLATLVRENENWRRPLLNEPILRGSPCPPPICAFGWRRSLDAARSTLLRSQPTAQATLSGCSCQSHQDLQGLGDAVPQTMGPDTARHLARYAIHAAQLAPKLYNPASAMDQVLEAVSPGLSKKVTAKAGAMMLKGVMPQTALEEAITESLVELAPKYPKYPKVPQQPALSGLGTTTTTTYTGRAATMRGAGSLIDSVAGAVEGLVTGITNAVVSVREQRSAQEQQSFNQRMEEANAERRAAEDAAIRDAGGLLPQGGGGIGLGTILLVGLGLATAGGAIYYVTKKK